MRYGRRLALDRVSFDVPPGETVAVVGPNGAGKTTLFRAILGALEPSVGSVERVRAARVRAAERRRGAALPRDRARRGADGRPTGDGRGTGRSAARCAARRSTSSPASGSPTARARRSASSRAASASACCSRARCSPQRPLLLLDEPLNGVDATTQEVIVSILAELRAEGRSMLISTHDLAMARRISTSMLFLNQTVVAYGPVDEAFTPDVLRAHLRGLAARRGQRRRARGDRRFRRLHPPPRAPRCEPTGDLADRPRDRAVPARAHAARAGAGRRDQRRGGRGRLLRRDPRPLVHRRVARAHRAAGRRRRVRDRSVAAARRGSARRA